MRRALNGFLSVLPPRIIVRWNISHLQANRRDPHYPFQSQFSAKPKENVKKKKKKVKIRPEIKDQRVRDRDTEEIEQVTDLFLEQWHRPEEPPHLPEPKFSELHFLFNEAVDKGGFPTEETWDRFVI